ncbi:MAG TPA: folylpolyglutamate synthase/dihydrofolate synthase family protein [Solirubrobacteraceae bacterium]|nr:folylpolyglutamate synthase/dihydrofolate synthase family protein [Solirubrobacteraceae bacterium]
MRPLTPAQAEERLLSLELFGMRFGLERMRRLMTALGHPERSFESIHVVGTNGKSSTTRMVAAILRHHGLRVGAYLSPHLVSYSERIRVGDRDLTPAEFAAAIERALRAAEVVNRTAGEDDQVTQFELLTAAAYSELGRREVQVAVVEAGLGGRYDATNVIPSKVQVLTSVGLEHTRWLGPTVEAIAREKLDVVQPGSTLVLGPDMHPDAVRVAEEVAGERDARIVRAGSDPGVPVAALGSFQRRNFAVARAAAEAFLGGLEESVVTGAAAEIRVPGRLQVVGEEPLTLLDGAHNPDGIAALAESLPEIAGRRRVVSVVSILDDKDAAGMLRTLAPLSSVLVLTSTRNPRALPPPTLLSLAGQVAGSGDLQAEVVRDPVSALRRARELAGADGVVVATGSIYLIADLLAGADRTSPRRASML